MCYNRFNIELIQSASSYLQLKRHCIEFGVVQIDSAIVVRRGAHTLDDNSAFVNSAGQLLLPGGVRPEWITSA